MNKFIYKPNLSLREIRELNEVSYGRSKENPLIDWKQKWFDNYKNNDKASPLGGYKSLIKGLDIDVNGDLNTGDIVRSRE